MKRGDIVRYKGHSTHELQNFECLRVLSVQDDKVWCSNMNMPFMGAFSGFISKDLLEKCK